MWRFIEIKFNGLCVLCFMLWIEFVFFKVVWSLVGEVRIEEMCLYVVCRCVMSIIKFIFIFEFLVFKKVVIVIILFVFVCVIIFGIVCDGGWVNGGVRKVGIGDGLGLFFVGGGFCCWVGGEN